MGGQSGKPYRERANPLQEIDIENGPDEEAKWLNERANQLERMYETGQLTITQAKDQGSEIKIASDSVIREYKKILGLKSSESSTRCEVRPVRLGLGGVKGAGDFAIVQDPVVREQCLTQTWHRRNRDRLIFAASLLGLIVFAILIVNLIRSRSKDRKLS